jgi:hypothetical protein
MIIFNNTSAEIRTKSADVLLKKIMILIELRIAQLCSEYERTLIWYTDRNGLKESNSDLKNC